MNASDFVTDGSYPSLEESLESFNPDVAGVNPCDDSQGPIYNYEWVDEVMQALNVSPDISSAFHVSLLLLNFHKKVASNDSFIRKSLPILTTKIWSNTQTSSVSIKSAKLNGLHLIGHQRNIS